MKHISRLGMEALLLVGLVTPIFVSTMIGAPKLKDLPSWFSKSSRNLSTLKSDSEKPAPIQIEQTAPVSREKATREQKMAMSVEERAQYKADRTATKESERAAMSEDARKTYDDQRAARKAAKEAGKQTPAPLGEALTTSIATSSSTSSTPAQEKKKIAGQDINPEDWNKMTLQEKKDASYRKFKKGSDEYNQGKEEYLASLSDKEKREHLQQSQDRKKSTAAKLGGGGIGGLSTGTIAILGVGALAAGAKALSDDDEKKSSGVAQVQIFEGGASPTSGIESGSFTPVPETSTTPAASGETFDAVAPVD